MSTYKRLGQILLAKGLISQEQLERALEARARGNLRLGEILVLQGLASEEAITRCLSEQYDLPIADLSSVHPSPEVLGLVTCAFALSRLFLPVQQEDGLLHAIVSDPIDVEATDMVEQESGQRLRLSLAPPSALSELIARSYALPPPAKAKPQGSALPQSKKRRVRIDSQADRRELLAMLNPNLNGGAA